MIETPRRPLFPRLAAVASAFLLVASQAAAQSVRPTPTPTAEPPTFPRTSEHVILITIDGFRPAVYLDSEKEGVAIPNLKALAGTGSFAEGVVVAYPSMTYPSHTSIVTGVSPARHGIISNTIFDPLQGSRLWYYKNSAVQVPSIWDIARKHGVKTAGVSWPVSVGSEDGRHLPREQPGSRRATAGWPRRARIPRRASWTPSCRISAASASATTSTR
jgi:predicted AlkP superfamily pyrophosphatase or phosphodiesterase